MSSIQSALLVDSNDFDNFINHRLLQQNGVSHIISFHDVKGALDYLKNTHVIYHLIIVDMDATEINGTDFINGFYDAGLDKVQGKVYALSSGEIDLSGIRSEHRLFHMIRKPLTVEQLTGNMGSAC